MTCFDSMLNIQPTNWNSHGRVLAFFSWQWEGEGVRFLYYKILPWKGPNKVLCWNRLIAGNLINRVVFASWVSFSNHLDENKTRVIKRTDHSLNKLVLFYPVLERHESTMGPNEEIRFRRRSLVVGCEHQVMNPTSLPHSRHGNGNHKHRGPSSVFRI
jgi:hypothetical protein